LVRDFEVVVTEKSRQFYGLCCPWRSNLPCPSLLNIDLQVQVAASQFHRDLVTLLTWEDILTVKKKRREHIRTQSRTICRDMDEVIIGHS
jgi:hypothetical protein